MGINRNIVECKYVLNSTVNSCKLVLIETLWNVNMLESFDSIKIV